MNGFPTMKDGGTGILRDPTLQGCTSHDCPLSTARKFRSHTDDIPEGSEASEISAAS